MKVIALHTLQRKTKGKFETIAPGTLINCEGQELEDFLAAGAVKEAPAEKPVSEPAETVDTGKGGKNTGKGGKPADDVLNPVGGPGAPGGDGHDLI